jgi:hypothetical protein
MPTCTELGGEERKKLLKGIDPNNERFWLMKKEEEDTDGLVLCAVESKIGDKAGGGVRVVRLHAPMQVGLRETITDKRFQMLQSAGTHNWGDIVDDLVDLEDLALNDGPVLHTLRMRYHHGPDVIFTAVGDVLLAVNPFRPVACCEEKALHDLMRMDINDLPPHIVKVARMAYAGMVEDCSAHAILVSGESGAGKTETAKIALRSIAIASRCTPLHRAHCEREPPAPTCDLCPVNHSNFTPPYHRRRTHRAAAVAPSTRSRRTADAPPTRSRRAVAS